jgi:hypothetical protein
LRTSPTQDTDSGERTNNHRGDHHHNGAADHHGGPDDYHRPTPTTKRPTLTTKRQVIAAPTTRWPLALGSRMTQAGNQNSLAGRL